VDDLLNRHDLTDEEWMRLAPLMPAHPRQGHRWNDHRTVINGILFRTRTGCPWRDLPAGFGNWNTVYGRHRRWSLDGTWEKVLDALRAGCDEADGRDWAVSADSAVVRAHQHAAGARRALLLLQGQPRLPAPLQAVIAVKEDQKNNRRARGRAGGRPPGFDAATVSATPSNAALPGSGSSAPSPPATTSGNSSTRAPSTPHRSGSRALSAIPP
jgi:transposase